MVKNLRLLFLTLLCAVFNVSMAQNYPTVSLPYEVNFTQGQGDFKIEDVTNELGTDIWTQGSAYGMTATTYLQIGEETKKTNHDGESWLVSPIIDLSNNTTASLAFKDQVNKYFGNIEEEITVNIREAGSSTWTNLNVVYEKPSSNWGGWIDRTVDLTPYAGKKIQIGFRYIGTATTAGTYEVKTFAVTTEEVVAKEPAGLKYSESTVVVYYGEEPYELPTLENPNNLPVTYSSNNENAATVDENGNVTVVGVGNTTIKAEFAGNDEFEEGNATFYLVVKERGEVGSEVFTLVTDASDLQADDKIIIVNEANDWALSTTQNGNNRAATEVTMSNDEITPSTAVQVITLEGEAGAWYFNTGSGYLYAASTSNNHLKTQAAADEKALVTTLDIDDDGVATVKFNQWGTEASPARTKLRYNPNSGNPIFSCYAESSTTGTAVRIYKKATTDVPKDPAGLEYSAEEFTYTIGGENEEFPTLSNPNQLPVTYSSSVESVATIDADGNITIVAAGETTIKASTEGDDTHKPGSASYVLTVEEPFLAITYELVNNAKTLKAGDKIILVNAEKTFAMSTTQANNNRRTAPVEPNKDGTITPGEDVEVITLGGEEGAWTLAVSGGYLYAPGGGNYLRTHEDPAEATIAINGEAGAEIIFVVDETISQKYLRYNANNQLFSCYVENSSIKDLGRIYREVRDYEEVEITAAGYATMYYGYKNLEVPAGVTAKTYKADANGLSESKTYAAGSVIPAGTAVVLEGNEGMYTFNVTEEEGTADANNMLLGFDEPTLTVGPNEADTYLFYILSTDKNGENVGFYFKEDGGAAFTSEAHKAYLAVPAETAASFYSFDSGSDGINNVVTNVNANDDVYSLSGVRMNGKLNKGIYIKNGKKVVIK